MQCPSCKTIYGEKTGTQPKGKMEVSTFPQSLPGHKDCGTIRIVYHISRGIQVSSQPAGREQELGEHPRHPGQPPVLSSLWCLEPELLWLFFNTGGSPPAEIFARAAPAIHLQ